MEIGKLYKGTKDYYLLLSKKERAGGVRKYFDLLFLCNTNIIHTTAWSEKEFNEIFNEVL